MKKLNEVIPSMQNSPEPDSEPDYSRSEQVWLQLAQMFGNAFYREHGEQPAQLWCNAIARLEDHEIKNGLANLGNDDLQFPANLSQFISACKRLKPVRQLGVKYIEDNRSRGHMSRKDWIGEN